MYAKGSRNMDYGERGIRREDMDRRMEERERRREGRRKEGAEEEKKLPLSGRDEKVGRVQPLGSSKRAADLVLAHRPFSSLLSL